MKDLIFTFFLQAANGDFISSPDDIYQNVWALVSLAQELSCSNWEKISNLQNSRGCLRCVTGNWPISKRLSLWLWKQSINYTKQTLYHWLDLTNKTHSVYWGVLVCYGSLGGHLETDFTEVECNLKAFLWPLLLSGLFN